MVGLKIELKGSDVIIEADASVSLIIFEALNKKEIRGDDKHFNDLIDTLQKKINNRTARFSIDEIRSLSQFLDIDLQKFDNLKLKGIPDELDNILGKYQSKSIKKNNKGMSMGM